MNQHKLDLDLGLPAGAPACDTCVTRLLDTVRPMRGVIAAHVDTADAKHPKLCLHYDRTRWRDRR